MSKYDVIVIGGGVMGTATTRALARRGRKVALLERFQIGHKRGSSHGASRIFRYSYPEKGYVQMAQEAHLLWKELEAEAGERLMTTVGGLDVGPNLDANIEALDSVRIPYEVLDGADVKRRFPMVNVGDDETVLFQPDGAIVGAERTWYALARLALEEGAEIHDNAQAVKFEDGKFIKVSTMTHEFEARAVVVTAGSWAKPLLAKVGIELDVTPTRETVAYFKVPDERIPTLVSWEDPLIYALPSLGQGLKVGEHIAGPVADPNDIGEPDPESVERIQAWVAKMFPWAEPFPHLKETCLYTNTPDESFVMERYGRIVVGSPCSGHGFKFAPLIGEHLATHAEAAVEIG